MDEKKFIIYKRFIETDQAESVIEILDENQIPYEIEDNSMQGLEVILGTDSAPKILLKLYPEDFEKANQLLNLEAAIEIESVEKDYYLFSFENDELLEVVSEQDSWSEFDVQLAKKILKDKGIEINVQLENAMKEKRVKDLSQQESGNSIWTIFGYISAIMGGLLGVVIGLSLWRAKKILPNGERIFIYKPSDRWHGMVISIIGIVMFLISIIIGIIFTKH
jgi:hypothetical protein